MDFDLYEMADPIDAPSWMHPEEDAGINDQNETAPELQSEAA